MRASVFYVLLAVIFSFMGCSTEEESGASLSSLDHITHGKRDTDCKDPGRSEEYLRAIDDIDKILRDFSKSQKKSFKNGLSMLPPGVVARLSEQKFRFEIGKIENRSQCDLVAGTTAESCFDIEFDDDGFLLTFDGKGDLSNVTLRAFGYIVSTLLDNTESKSYRIAVKQMKLDLLAAFKSDIKGLDGEEEILSNLNKWGNKNASDIVFAEAFDSYYCNKRQMRSDYSHTYDVFHTQIGSDLADDSFNDSNIEKDQGSALTLTTGMLSGLMQSLFGGGMGSFGNLFGGGFGDLFGGGMGGFGDPSSLGNIWGGTAGWPSAGMGAAYGCDWSEAHKYDGWGWNPTTQESCAPGGWGSW